MDIWAGSMKQDHTRFLVQKHVFLVHHNILQHLTVSVLPMRWDAVEMVQETADAVEIDIHVLAKVAWERDGVRAMTSLPDPCPIKLNIFVYFDHGNIHGWTYAKETICAARIPFLHAIPNASRDMLRDCVIAVVNSQDNHSHLRVILLRINQRKKARKKCKKTTRMAIHKSRGTQP